MLNDTPTDSYPRGPYDPSIGADQVDMQVNFWIRAMTSRKLGLAAYQTPPSTRCSPTSRICTATASTSSKMTHYRGYWLRSRGGFGKGRRNVTPEVDVPATATRTLQPFSWVSPSTFGPLHAIFLGVPFARSRVAAFIHDSVPLFQHRMRTDQYGVDTTISEEARIQQVAPL